MRRGRRIIFPYPFLQSGKILLRLDHACLDQLKWFPAAESQAIRDAMYLRRTSAADRKCASHIRDPAWYSQIAIIYASACAKRKVPLFYRPVKQKKSRLRELVN